MKRRNLSAIICIAVMSLVGCVSICAAEETPDIFNNIYYPQSTYNEGVNQSPQEVTQDIHNSPVSRETYSYDVVDGCIKQTVCIEGGTDNPTVISSEYTDQYGNVVKKTVGTSIETYTYDYMGNQISKSITIIKPEGDARSYSMGEATSGHIAFYDYDCYNRLTGVDTNGVASTYTYLPDGMRHSKTVDGVTTTFVYDGANIIEEVTSTDTKKYYRGIEIVKNDDNLYYIYNGQGDVAILTNAEGVVASYTFDAYGNMDSTGEVYNPFGYRGEYTDSESGLIYLRARLYDPETGRFINEDPIKDGLNWYVYCGNDSINYIDTTGLAIWLVHGTFNGTADNECWVSTDFWSQETQNYVAEIFNNEPLYAEAWSGRNSVADRKQAAEELKDMVMAYVNENGGVEGCNLPIRLVGHSHGGNVAILAANLLAKEGVIVETLITIATPVRSDYQLNKGSVKQHINVYNTGDFVQASLGGRIQNLGRAKRTYANADNIEVPKLPNYYGLINRGIANHGFMHNNPQIWKKHIVPIIN